MARLFLAIELTPEVREAIVSRQLALADAVAAEGGSALRLVKSPQLHLTIVFVGEVDEAVLPGIADAMSRPLPVPAFELAFGSCGIFPLRGPARVLWIGVSAGVAELALIAATLTERVELAGARVDHRPFVPHLTIGRWRERGGSTRRPHLPQIGPVAAQIVSSVTLFQSRLLPTGPEHTALVRAPLASGREPLH